MTGRRKHPIWFYFNEEITQGKSKRAICKDCKLSIVALVERMIKHKMTCTNNIKNKIEQNSNVDNPVEKKNIININNYETEAFDTNFNNGNLYNKLKQYVGTTDTDLKLDTYLFICISLHL